MLSACGSLSRSRQKVWVNAVRTQVIATKWEDDSEENNIFGHPKVVSERFVETQQHGGNFLIVIVLWVLKVCSYVRPHFPLEATQEVGIITPICQLGKQRLGANELQGWSCAAWRVAGAPDSSPLSQGAGRAWGRTTPSRWGVTGGYQSVSAPGGGCTCDPHTWPDAGWERHRGILPCPWGHQEESTLVGASRTLPSHDHTRVSPFHLCGLVPMVPCPPLSIKRLLNPLATSLVPVSTL